METTTTTSRAPLLRLCIASFLLALLPAGRPNLASDAAALLALRASLGGTAALQNWNATSPPCGWRGVFCRSGRVVALRLPGGDLVGTIPEGVLGNLTELRTLSLRSNALTGPLPQDLARCTQLRNLYLQNNKLSGEIPDSLFSLHNLIHLDLAKNNFSGSISPAFDKLDRLRTLYLERNQISGQIPNLSLPDLARFNVSMNQLNGSIPSGLSSMPASAFAGMSSLCGLPLTPCPGSISPAPAPAPSLTLIHVPASSQAAKHKKSKLSGGAIAGIAIGSAAAALILLFLVYFVCRRKRGGASSKARSVGDLAAKQPEAALPGKGIVDGASFNGTANHFLAPAAAAANFLAPAAATANGDGGSKKLVFFGNAPSVFELEDLLRASAEVLGKGAFGTTYKAMLEYGMAVAVKRLKDVNVPEAEFLEKIESIRTMEHPNLLPLRAYSREEKLLVYDYMALGSLSALLHGKRGSTRTPIDWEVRSAIALSAARGIEYIHSRGPGASHGNIKSSNILLVKSNDACVAEHCVANIVGLPSMPSRLAGYRAPEVTDARRVSQKADVYSFGILLLELLTGKAPAQAFLDVDGVDLPRWVQSVVKEEWSSEVFDSELMRSSQNVEDDMVQLLQLAVDCAATYPDRRPSMSEVVAMIEGIRRSGLGTLDSNHHLSTDSVDA